MNGEFVLAVHAMVYLHHRGGFLSSEAIAENVCTNPVCVRKVMAKLVRANLAETRRGRTRGGYCYEKTKTVTLREIAEALDVNFVEAAWHSGDEQKPCMIASGMSGYIDDLCAEMNELCGKLLQRVTVADVEGELAARAARKTEQKRSEA